MYLILPRLLMRHYHSQTFPDIWKKGKLFSSTNQTIQHLLITTDLITILPILSKILEHVVHQQVYQYLRQNKLITSEQFGFRPKLSTNIDLTQLTEEILQNMDKMITDAVFIDLRKGFDTVDHSLLISKLRNLAFQILSLTDSGHIYHHVQQIHLSATRHQIRNPLLLECLKVAYWDQLLFLLYNMTCLNVLIIVNQFCMLMIFYCTSLRKQW